MNKASQQDIRQILGKFLTGVTVVTTLDENDTPVGFTANSFTSVSLDPPLILVCLARSAGLALVFGQANSFAINILSKKQEAISNDFASKKENRFSDTKWVKKSTGSPIIEHCAAWLDCKMHDKIIAGDHIILIGEIVEGEKSDSSPLGYYQGRYCQIDRPEKALNRDSQNEIQPATPGLLFDEDDPFAF